MAKKLSHEEVLEKIKKIHGDLYDLSQIEYNNTRTPFILVCRKHGQFTILMGQVDRGQGCNICGKSNAAKKRRVTFDEFVKNANKIHKSKYEYDKSSYVKISHEVKILCSVHGWFTQRADAHIRQAQGCPDCGFISQANKRRMSVAEFKKKAKKVHLNKYSYTYVRFKNNRDSIEVICKKHGSFYPSVANHLGGSGCPDCNNSRGENKVKKILIENQIEFIQQKSFKGLKLKGMLKCDFYLPKLNAVIEFNGRQHYEIVEAFGGKKGFQDNKIRDQLKREFLAKKGIALLEIHYLEKEINKVISDFINRLESKKSE